MKVSSLRILLPITALLCAFAPNAARAQAPLEPAQMSPRTVFYLVWRGVPMGDVRKANSVLALWDDAEFAPVRSAIAAGMLNSSGEKTEQPKLTSAQVQEFAGLLENSFTVGYLSEPAKRRAAPAEGAPDSQAAAWNGMFFVYDRRGKEDLLSKAILGLRASAKEVPRLSPITIGGVQALKAESKNGVNYWAEDGKYAVGASELAVMEEILGRLNGKASAGASLAQSAAYQEAQKNLGGGLLEFFLRVPDLEQFATESQARSFQVRPLLDAARLDAVHSLSGRVLFEGAKTHVQGAILGDAVPGTPFDIWAGGQPLPASLAFVPAEANSYTWMQLNLQGIYDTVKRVARAAFPQAQQGNADLMDAIAQEKLGMPVTEALGLFSGEFASMQTSPSMDAAKQVYLFGMRKKPETLKLLRAVFSEQLASERNEGDVTFLKISLGGKQSSAGDAQWNFFNLAVTQDMILGASKIETLREVLSNRAQASSAAGLASERRQFQENLNGLSYFDFQKIDWQAVKDRWSEEAKKSSAAKSVSASKDAAPSTASDWLAQINPQVFSRHLHYSSSVSWKDAKGIHWDQWVE